MKFTDKQKLSNTTDFMSVPYYESKKNPATIFFFPKPELKFKAQKKIFHDRRKHYRISNRSFKTVSYSHTHTYTYIPIYMYKALYREST